MIKGIAYVGIAVKDIQQARENFNNKFGSEIMRIGESDVDKVKNTYLRLGKDIFELMEPYSPESPVARFIKRRGEGVQYIGLEVEDLDEAISVFRKRGVRFTTDDPVEYPNGSRWAFIHPKEMHGVLFALIENPV